MNICFINFNKNWGGVKTWTLDYGKMLIKKGHRVTAVVRPGTPFETECTKAGFDVHSFRPGMKYNPASIIKVMRILKKTKTDICIVNISKDINIGAAAAKLCGIPVIRRVGLPQDYSGSFEERFLRKLTDAVIVPSNYLKNEIKDTPAAKGIPIYVIPNSKLAESYHSRTYVEKSRTVFGVTSQLSVTKGHKYLIDAFEMVLADGIDAELRISGTGSYMAELQNYAKEKGLADSVHFTGFTNDIHAFLSELDIFVLPSLTESFGNTLLEAMFAELPCIAFSTGGIPEVMGDCGTLVEPKNVKELAEAMIHFASSPGLRYKVGRQAKERALEKYSLSTNINLLESLLTSILRKEIQHEL